VTRSFTWFDAYDGIPCKRKLVKSINLCLCLKMRLSFIKFVKMVILNTTGT